MNRQDYPRLPPLPHLITDPSLAHRCIHVTSQIESMRFFCDIPVDSCRVDSVCARPKQADFRQLAYCDRHNSTANFYDVVRISVEEGARTGSEYYYPS